MDAPRFYFTIHDETGRRINDDSDYDMTAEEIDNALRDMAAEKVILADREAAWKVGDDANGYQYLRISGAP